MWFNKGMEKFAFVSGSATRLGFAIATHLLENDFGLIAHYHKNEDGIRTLEKTAHSLKKPFYFVQSDLSTSEGIAHLLAQLDGIGLQTIEKVAAVVNAASIMPREGMGKLTSDNLERVFTINTFAPILISQYFATKAKGKLSIINLSDVGAQLYWTKFAAYSLSKYTLERSSSFFSKEFAPLVRANNIGLGILMASDWMEEDLVANLTAKIPAGRFGSLDELLSVIDLLLTNEYITGQTITLDGGRSLDDH